MRYIKHLFITLLLVFLFFFQVTAQHEIGLLVGLSNNKLTGDPPPRGAFRYKMGFQAAVHIDFELSDYVRLSFQPGIRSGGAKVAFKDPDLEEFKDSLKVNVALISFPLFLKITSLSEKVYFIGGFTFEIPSKIKADNGDEKIDISDELKKYNISANFGLGFKIPVKSTTGYIELRYIQGLVNVSENLDEDLAYLPRTKSTAMQLLFGWQLPIKKNK